MNMADSQGTIFYLKDPGLGSLLNTGVFFICETIKHVGCFLLVAEPRRHLLCEEESSDIMRSHFNEQNFKAERTALQKRASHSQQD